MKKGGYGDMTMGEKIKSARMAKKLTQRQLADLIDVKHNSISDWESDKHAPDIDTLEKICRALDVTSTYLMGQKSDDEYGNIVGNLMNQPDLLDMIEEYQELNSEDKKAIRQLISSLYKASGG